MTLQRIRFGRDVKLSSLHSHKLKHDIRLLYDDVAV